MTDTARTKSSLLTALFQDSQPAGSITPQDVRDLIISLTPDFGGFSFTVPAATTISTPGTMVKASGTTAVSNLRNMTHPTDNRLTYTGIPDRHFHISLSTSFTTVGTNDDISMAIAKNGVVITHSKLTRFIGTSGDRGSISNHADIVLSTNDFLEIFTTNEDAAASVTVQQGYMFTHGMIS